MNWHFSITREWRDWFFGVEKSAFDDGLIFVGVGPVVFTFEN